MPDHLSYCLSTGLLFLASSGMVQESWIVRVQSFCHHEFKEFYEVKLIVWNDATSDAILVSVEG